jgi:hypothetical protein
MIRMITAKSPIRLDLTHVNLLRTRSEICKHRGGEKAFPSCISLVDTTTDKYNEAERYEKECGYGQPYDTI